ncbi:hypothetical protein DRJ48_03820, partial [Candidatus Woesearchaeota archaeon]
MSETLNEYIQESKRIKASKAKLAKQIRVAFLSNFTLKWFSEVLSVLCYKNRISAEVYTAPYNQYTQEILNKASKLYKFEPQLTVLILDAKKLLGKRYDFPYRLSPKERRELIDATYNELIGLVERILDNLKTIVLLHNFRVPLSSPMGILENKQEFGFVEMIEALNSKLREYAKQNKSVFVFDFNRFCLKYGLSQVSDKRLEYLADMRFAPEIIPKLCEEYLGYIIPILSMTKKCLVLDLDNTLWGGIIGEDGIEGIKLGPEKEGLPFLEFQKRILNLFERGIILAINSKNNPEDALKVLREHPYMLLREEHFASMKINWNDKVSNMIEIAKEINIGLGSLVFIDDDKLNRALVREQLPEVTVVELPEDIALYPEVIDNLKVFNTLQITKEDLQKGRMYAQQRKRTELMGKVANLDEFLKRLKMRITLYKANQFNIPRIAQLTQKTNQFNMTTKRYLEQDIKEFAESQSYEVYCAQVEDRFGDNGITGVVIIEKKPEEKAWVIDTFLLSCRIIGRKVEDILIAKMAEKARAAGANKLIG